MLSTCNQCGQQSNSIIFLNRKTICHDCKPFILQRLKEGIPNSSLDKQSINDNSIRIGIAIGMFLHFNAFLAIIFTMLVSHWIFASIGLLQWIYLIPVMNHYEKRKMNETSKGLFISGIALLLMNIILLGICLLK